MKTLAVFDDKNYDSRWRSIKRCAARAVIVRNGNIALVKSRKEGFYKFPGGGAMNGETHIQTLCRETMEETGLTINVASVREMGMLHEVRKSVFDEDAIFDQKSYYYFADVEDVPGAGSLDDYEAELGFALEWINIRSAYETNMWLSSRYETKFILREAFVLGLLLGIPASPGNP